MRNQIHLLGLGKRVARVVAMSIFLCSLLSAQNKDDYQISDEVYHIIFLHMHVWDAQQRLSPQGQSANVPAMVSRLNLESHEINILDNIATEFVEQEQELAQEAKRYHIESEAADETVDPAVVRSFSTRRYELAEAAFRNIYSRLSPEGAEALRRFVASTFRSSVERFGGSQ